MDIKELYNDINSEDFTSNSAVIQTRILGFITTNIRSTTAMITYIEKLFPKYLEHKDNLANWKEWCYNDKNQEIYKQYFKRMELAKILFRDVIDSPYMNNIGEKLYNIGSKDKNHLEIILSLYLLSGTYFGTENQPLVEIEKIINSFKGDILLLAKECLEDETNNRFLLGTMFYNPKSEEAYNLAYKLFGGNVSENEIIFLNSKITEVGSKLNIKIKNAGGIKNFKKDVFVIINYYLFKKACKKFPVDISDMQGWRTNILKTYIDDLFEHNFYNIKDIDKESFKKILIDNKKIIEDLFLFASDIKGDQRQLTLGVRKGTIKKQSFEKYNYKCFFDYFDYKSDVHAQSYFKDKKDKIFLEAHHMIQISQAKHFEKDIDIVENLIPLCPNCHRKLHNGNNDLVKELIRLFYKKSNKEDLQKKGIFVDITTLGNFYGIEDLKE